MVSTPLGQPGAHTLQVACDLFAGGPIPIAQLAPHVFPRLGQERQDRLIAFLSPVFRVVTLAPAHLVAEQGVHRGIGVQGDGFQFHMRGLPHALPHNLLDA
jgi:hypothetical protein